MQPQVKAPPIGKGEACVNLAEHPCATIIPVQIYALADLMRTKVVLERPFRHSG